MQRIELRSLQGKWVHARARCIVLACGGLENPRQLLLANLGNQYDLVGRFFMEHPSFQVGTITPTDPYILVDRYYRHSAGGRLQRSAWSFLPSEQDHLGVANCSVGLAVLIIKQAPV